MNMRLWTIVAVTGALTLLVASVIARPSGATAQTTVASNTQCSEFNDGKMITVGLLGNGRGDPGTVQFAVANAIAQKGLPFSHPQAPLLRSTGGTGGGNVWKDNGSPHIQTLTAVCEILGYKHYVASTCLDSESSGRYPNGKCNYHSPNNNQLSRFTGNFQSETAEPKYNKTWLSSITCKDSIGVCLPSSSSSSSVSQAQAACRDGIDNDQDGATDYPDDFSCSSPNDDDEANPKAQCQDGVDNDGDGLVDYPQDPGCFSRQDNNEFNAVSSSSSSSSAHEAQCRDGIDNDGDGAKDYPDDFSCGNPNDDDETNPKAQCQDGVDNDGDGKTDYPNDPGCYNRQDNDEWNAVSSSSSFSSSVHEAECRDGIDNDGDGSKDYPDDFSCGNPNDDDETNPKAQCQDGVDNDGDGKTDYPNDPGCYNRQDNDEYNAVSSSSSSSSSAHEVQCRDGVDNDGDGAKDYPDDFSCSNPNDDDETNPKAQCQDGVDNDGDGKVDFPSDPGCYNRQDNDEYNAVSSSSSSSSSYSSSSSSSSQPFYGCIDVIKETFDTLDNPFNPVPQFTFYLDNVHEARNDGSGRVRYTGVNVGNHRVHEMVQQGWYQLSVTPTNGDVYVNGSDHCAVVVFKNKQYITASSSSSSSSSSSYSSSSSSGNWWYPVSNVNVNNSANTTVNSEINAVSQNNTVINQNGGANQNAEVNNNAQTNVNSVINAASQNVVSVTQQQSAGQWHLPSGFEFWSGNGISNNAAFLRPQTADMQEMTAGQRVMEMSVPQQDAQVQVMDAARVEENGTANEVQAETVVSAEADGGNGFAADAWATLMTAGIGTGSLFLRKLFP